MSLMLDNWWLNNDNGSLAIRLTIANSSVKTVLSSMHRRDKFDFDRQSNLSNSTLQ
jgi:hypothetical protein